jgi:hypothetical protein
MNEPIASSIVARSASKSASMLALSMTAAMLGSDRRSA